MLGEKKRWFKILTWSKYQELKDKPLKYENELTNLRAKITSKDNEISTLEKEKVELKLSLDDAIKELNEAVAVKTQAENERDKAFDDMTKLRKNHAEEKSCLRNEIKELKDELSALKEKGIVVPKRVPGSTKPRKKQAIKETIKPVKN